MRNLRSTFLAFALVLVAAASGLADEGGQTSVEATARTEDLPDVIGRVAGSAAAQASYRSCPAEVWDTARPFWRRGWDRLVGSPRMKEGACDADPLACLSSCLAWKNGGACFQAARTLQEHAGRDQHAAFQALFAHACAMGYPAGCTNRAAGALNGGYDGDPIPDPDEPKTALCLTRAFEIACGREDAWGCTMFGMAQRFGEGVPVDASRARAAFEKSCAIAPNFAACGSAKSQIAEMDELKEGTTPKAE